MSNWVILIRLVLSTLMGGAVGMEREMHGRAAGLRTHILVCVGSTLFMVTSILVADSYAHMGGIDPSRIAAGVVTGIGFLGAGAIIRFGASVRGLTTAASIWAVSAIGLAAGAGFYVPAAITTVVVLAVLILSRLEERMELKQHGKKLVVSLRSDKGTSTDDIKNVIYAYEGRIICISSEKEGTGETQRFMFDLILSRSYHKDIVSEIASLPGVEGVSWR